MSIEGEKYNPDDCPEFNNMYGKERIEWANKYIRSKPTDFVVYHGDAFHWIAQGYRNEQLLFWHDTCGAIPPFTEIDDYGSVPHCFIVGNDDGMFHPGNWVNDVDHNSIIFPSKELIEEINKRLVKSKNIWSCKITIQEVGYTVKSQTNKITSEYCQYYNNDDQNENNYGMLIF